MYDITVVTIKKKDHKLNIKKILDQSTLLRDVVKLLTDCLFINLTHNNNSTQKKLNGATNITNVGVLPTCSIKS